MTKAAHHHVTPPGCLPMGSTGKGSTPTARELVDASKAQLECWIKEINSAAGKKVMNTSAQTKDVLHERLATHLGLDTSPAAVKQEIEAKQHAAVAAGPLTLEREIQRRQWAHVRSMGDKWRAALAKGEDFRLLHRGTGGSSAAAATGSDAKLSEKLDRGLSGRTESAAGDWYAAAAKGDSEAIAHLARVGLLNGATVAPSPGPCKRECEPQTRTDVTVTPKLAPHDPVLHPPPSEPPSTTGSLTSFESLCSGLANLEATSAGASAAAALPPALNTALAALHPSGSVAVVLLAPIAGFFPPPSSQSTGQPNTITTSPPTPAALPLRHSEPADSASPSLTQGRLPDVSPEAAALRSCELDIDSLERPANLREVLDQLESGHVERIRKAYGPSAGRASSPQWKGIRNTVTKRERLYEVFKTDFASDRCAFLSFFRIPAAAKKRKGQKPQNAEQEAFRPFRAVVEAIPHVTEDIDTEMAKAEYRGGVSGEFSDALWKARWGTMNRWEVWRALDLELYGVYRQKRLPSSSTVFKTLPQ
ncbi:hypothetical protein PsYK624_054660 [Phanerochaete sordida]|uniref:Uncharacterized protein n=1 Tax=Phanerochaete sordida TaxID=48140 RepID=A0A9P3LCZ1_9APHY|nr:hypothetical protein PsYK624_054660 [Phanerochaete sordida]